MDEVAVMLISSPIHAGEGVAEVIVTKGIGFTFIITLSVAIHPLASVKFTI